MEDDSVICNCFKCFSLFVLFKSCVETDCIAAHFGQDTPVKEICNLRESLVK